MKWLNALRWSLEIYLLSIQFFLIYANYMRFYGDLQYPFDFKLRLVINLFFILFILIRVVILISKLRLNWSRKYFLIDFEWKSRIWSLIAVIGYAICLIPDMYYNIIVYLYEGEYLIRILVLPPPIILGLIDLYLFKPRKKMLS